MLIGDYIKKKRLESGKSQSDVAKVLGVSITVVWNVEKHRKRLGKIKAEQWANALELDENEKIYFYNLIGATEKSIAPDLRGFLATHPEINDIIRAMMVAEMEVNSYKY